MAGAHVLQPDHRFADPVRSFAGTRGALGHGMAELYEMGGCPACGSESAHEIASADDVRAELEVLWAFHTRRLRPDTPAHHLADRLVFSQRPPLRIVRCVACGTVHRNPRERAHTLEDVYADEALAPEVMDRLFASQRASYAAQAERLTALAGRTGSGLEVGSYVGGFLAAARALGWQFRGVDVNASAVAHVRARGLDAEHGTIESMDPAVGSYDAIAIWNCLDQLAHPRAALAAAARLLRPGGLLAVRVPNGAFYARMRHRLDGPGAPLARALLAWNNLLSFPYRTGFTPSSLRRMLEAHGLRVVSAHGDALVPLADAWTRPWAAAEERMLKRTIRLLPSAATAPWFELYARAPGSRGARGA